MEDGGGWRSPGIHPPASWAMDGVAALTSTWVPCFELLPARDRAAASLGTGGDDVGWYFPCGVPEYTLFPRHVVTNVLLCECMCVCV